MKENTLCTIKEDLYASKFTGDLKKINNRDYIYDNAVDSIFKIEKEKNEAIIYLSCFKFFMKNTMHIYMFFIYHEKICVCLLYGNDDKVENYVKEV